MSEIVLMCRETPQHPPPPQKKKKWITEQNIDEDD